MTFTPGDGFAYEKDLNAKRNEILNYIRELETKVYFPSKEQQEAMLKRWGYLDTERAD
jgi:hypothetical protein